MIQEGNVILDYLQNRRRVFLRKSRCFPPQRRCKSVHPSDLYTKSRHYCFPSSSVLRACVGVQWCTDLLLAVSSGLHPSEPETLVIEMKTFVYFHSGDFDVCLGNTFGWLQLCSSGPWELVWLESRCIVQNDTHSCSVFPHWLQGELFKQLEAPSPPNAVWYSRLWLVGYMTVSIKALFHADSLTI